MGNSVVIPSYGNWYIDPLKKMKIKFISTIESSTFFLTLECLDENNNPVIVKAYQYTELISPLPVVQYSWDYFHELSKSEDKGICGFKPIKIVDKCVFMVRPKFEYTLSQRLSDYPLPVDIEKWWISYQFLTAVKTFHDLNLVHGNLHPENVFISWDLRLTIGDPAPYKPPQIRYNQPQIFIHFFGSSNTHCYLSPRRLILNEQDIIHEFQDLDKSDDIFAVGCILYFIFTQKHLFSLTTMGLYKEGKYNDQIELSLEELPIDIRPFVKHCISLDSIQRTETFNNYKAFFPAYFSQFYDQIEVFFNSQVSLQNFVYMIPAFEAYATIGGNDVRIILTNILAQFLLKSDDLMSKVKFSYFFVDFFTPLSDEMLLTRVLPNIIGLLDPTSTLMTRTVFNCLETLFNNVKIVPSYLKLMFLNYLVPTLSKSAHTSSVNIKCAICEFVPKLIRIASRLDPESAPSFIKIYAFIMQETEQIVLDCFITSFKILIKSKMLDFNDVSPQLFSCLNSPNKQFRAELLNLFRLYYPYLESKDIEVFKKRMNDLLSVAFLLDGDKTMISILELIDWLLETDLIYPSHYPSIFNFISSPLDSSDPKVRYLTGQILRKLPQNFSDAYLPGFILKSLNHRKSWFNPRVKPPTIKKDDWPAPTDLLKKNPKYGIDPLFLNSQRISHYPITSVLPVSNHDGFSTIASDINGNVYHLSVEKSQLIFDYKKSITCGISLPGTDSGLFITPEKIIEINWNPLNIISLPFVIEQPQKSIHSLINNHCFMTIGEDSEVTFYDRRQSQIIHKIQCNDLNLNCACVWPNMDTVCFGYNEGLVSLFDVRTFLPCKNFVTVPAKTICPLYHSSGGFFVGGTLGAQTFAFDSNQPFATLPFDVQISLPYNNSILFIAQNMTGILQMGDLDQPKVIVCNDQSTFILPTEKEIRSQRNNIWKSSAKLQIADNENCVVYSDHLEPLPPLHNHSTPLTAISNIQNMIVTADKIGNVNFFTLNE